MRSKYEAAMKEKMLITLERDRVVGILAAMPLPYAMDESTNQTPRTENVTQSQVDSPRSKVCDLKFDLSPSIMDIWISTPNALGMSDSNIAKFYGNDTVS